MEDLRHHAEEIRAEVALIRRSGEYRALLTTPEDEDVIRLLRATPTTP